MARGIMVLATLINILMVIYDSVYKTDHYGDYFSLFPKQLSLSDTYRIFILLIFHAQMILLEALGDLTSMTWRR